MLLGNIYLATRCNIRNIIYQVETTHLLIIGNVRNENAKDTCGVDAFTTSLLWERGSSARTVSDHRLDDRGSIPGRSKGFFF
jgi:hypothetical protein